MEIVAHFYYQGMTSNVATSEYALLGVTLMSERRNQDYDQKCAYWESKR